MAKNEKVVLAYSGGLDTSVILPWLKETYGYDVIAFAAELGQGDELEGIKKKALKSGAVKCIVKDLRREFVTDYIWPVLKAGAVYESDYLLGKSIARPLIAKYQVDIGLLVELRVGGQKLHHSRTQVSIDLQAPPGKFPCKLFFAYRHQKYL